MRSRFQHLLVPAGFGEEHEPALEVAYEMASANGARLTLLHVIETIEDAAEEEFDEFYSELEANARSRLADIAERFVEAGLTVQQEVLVGKRIRDIVRYSMEQQVDLVVLTSPRFDPQQPQRTLSYQISLLCQCPVLLVK